MSNAASSTLPQGFQPVADPVEESVNYPVVKPENFAGKGRTVVYHGSKQTRNDNVMHIVSPQEKPDAKYILWGSAMLNRKLDKAGAGEIIFIQYLGKEPHPAFENGQHSWVVARSSTAPATPAAAGRPAAVANWDE